jgi:hypothetical protein
MSLFIDERSAGGKDTCVNIGVPSTGAERTPWADVANHIEEGLSMRDAPEALQQQLLGRVKIAAGIFRTRQECMEFIGISSCVCAGHSLAEAGDPDRRERLFEEIKTLHPTLARHNPGTVASVVGLRYLMEQLPPGEAEALRQEFGGMNWLLSRDCVEQMKIT